MRPTTPVAVAAVVRNMQHIQERYASGYGVDEFVTDMLADLRHFCDARHLSFAKLDRRACDHYITERFLESHPSTSAGQITAISVYIPEKAWIDVSDKDDSSFLSATLNINGLDYPMIAIRVRNNGRGQEPTDYRQNPLYHWFRLSAAAKGSLLTTRIGSGDYVLGLAPPEL